MTKKPNTSLRKWIRSVSNFIDLVKCWQNFLGLNRIGPYLSLQKENFMLTYFVKGVRKIRKFHVAVIQRRLRTYKKKKRDARAELLFCWCKPVTFFPFLFAVAGVVKLPIVVIQKFCHHGNVTSYFSSLLMCHCTCPVSTKLWSINIQDVKGRQTCKF